MRESEVVGGGAPGAAQRVLRAFLLAAVVVVPILFHARSEAIFEPVRAMVVRALLAALIGVGVAWLVAGGRPSRTDLARLWREPLGLACLLTVLVWLVGTTLSVDPYLSLWGAITRSQGLLTSLAYPAVFIATLYVVRSEAASRRVLQAMVFASAPVVAYGMVQALDADPLNWVGATRGRISAQAGNPIFLGAHLIMVIPVTLALGAEALVGFRKRGRSVALPAVAYGAIVLFQLAALLLTRSRGPVLGLLAGLVFLALIGLRFAPRRVARRTLGFAAATLVFLVVLVMPSSPFQVIRDAPALRWTGIERYSGLFQPGSGTVASRIILWELMSDVATEDLARLPLGYGLETQMLTHTKHYQPQLAGMELNRTADRAHNRSYDLVVTGGLAAFAADLLLFGGVIWLILAAVGALATPRRRWLFGTAAGTGLALGGLVPWIWGAPALAGPFVPIGGLVAVFVFLFVDVVWGRSQGGSAGSATAEDGPTPAPHWLLLAALGAVAVAHHVETQVGIETVTTRLYFWTVAGLAAVLCRPVAPEIGEAEEDDRRTREWGLIVGLGLATTAFGIVTATSPLSSPVPALVAMVAAAWLVGALFVDRERVPAFGVVSLAVFAGLLALQVAWVGWAGIPELSAAGSLNDLIVEVGRLSWTLPVGAASVAAVILGFTWRPSRYARGLLAVAAGLVVAIPVAVGLSLSTARAAVFVHMAERYEALGGVVPAASLYSAAAGLRPEEPTYYAHLARTNMSATSALPEDSNERPAVAQLALGASQRARDLRPMDPRFHQALGEIETAAGLVAQNEELRRAHYDRSEAAFVAALDLGPAIPGIWTSRGQWALRRGDISAAVEHLERARAMDPGFQMLYGHLGAAYLEQERWDDARTAFRQAVELRRGDWNSWQGLGTALARLGEREAAVQAYLTAVERGARDMLTFQNLAIVLGELGRVELAITYAERALQAAPPNAASAVQRMLNQLRAAAAAVPPDAPPAPTPP